MKFAIFLAAIIVNLVVPSLAAEAVVEVAAIKKPFHLVGHAMNGDRWYLTVNATGFIKSTMNIKRARPVTLKGGSFFFDSKSAIIFKQVGDQTLAVKGPVSKLGPRRFVVDNSNYVLLTGDTGYCLGFQNEHLAIGRCRRSIMPMYYEQL